MEDNDAPSGLPGRGGTKLDFEGIGLGLGSGGKGAGTALRTSLEQKWPRDGEAA